MGLFDRMLNDAISNVAGQVINEAGKHIVRNVKESGVIESTVDDLANKMTNGTKYSKIMKCPYCQNEYDNTLQNCPSCGAVNENRKYDYQAAKNNDTQITNHLLQIGDMFTDGQLIKATIIGIEGNRYKTKDMHGMITYQDISTIDTAITEEKTFWKM